MKLTYKTWTLIYILRYLPRSFFRLLRSKPLMVITSICFLWFRLNGSFPLRLLTRKTILDKDDGTLWSTSPPLFVSTPDYESPLGPSAYWTCGDVPLLSMSVPGLSLCLSRLQSCTTYEIISCPSRLSRSFPLPVSVSPLCFVTRESVSQFLTSSSSTLGKPLVKP